MELNWIRYKFSAASQISLDLKSRFTLFFKLSIPSPNTFLFINFFGLYFELSKSRKSSDYSNWICENLIQTVNITVSFDSKKHIFLFFKV